MDPRPAFHHLAEDDEGGQWTWKNATVVVDFSGAAEHVKPKRRGPRMEKGSMDHKESKSRIMDNRTCPSELLKGLNSRTRCRLQM